MKLLHIAKGRPASRVWTPPFISALKELGELQIVENGAQLSPEEGLELMRSCDVLLTSWNSLSIPKALAADRGRLRYICNVTGSVRGWVPLEIVEAGIPVTNWGDAPDFRIAEGAMTLLLAAVKNLRRRIKMIEDGGWNPDGSLFSSTLEGMNIGIYGCGAIGRRFISFLKPFAPVIRIYDPYVSDIPEGCSRVSSLEELFTQSEAIVIHAGLSNETRGSITANLLAKLPDNGIIINTARGAIIDQATLFAELERGRLIAGLDVLEPDWLPADHPARHWPSLILTAHDIGTATSREQEQIKLQRMHRICLDNLRRFAAGEPLVFLIDRDRWLRST